MELRSWGSALHPLSAHSASRCAHQHVPNFLSSGRNLRSAFDNVTVLRFLSFKRICPKGHDDWMSYIKQYKTFEFQVLSNSPLCPKHGHQPPFHLCVLKSAVVFLRFYLQAQAWFPVASNRAGTEKEFIKRSWSKTLVRTKLGSH